MNLDISEPKPQDYAGMASLLEQVSPRQGGDAFSVDAIAKRCQASLAINLVARADGRVLALLMCGPTSTRGHEVTHLVVSPDQPDQAAVGRVLIDKLLMKLAARGVHTFQLAPSASPALGGSWEHARWEGRCDLNGQAPVGKSSACAIA